MQVEIVEVKNAGNLESEVLVLRSNQEININKYIVMDDTYTPSGDASNKHRHVFEFPSKTIKKDEKIYLHTRKGDSQTKNGEHHFYWGLKNTVWNAKGDCVHLICVEERKNKKI